MRFDTEEAFFRATYNMAGISPAQMGENAEISVRTGEDVRYAVTSDAVKLVRAAFGVHQRCIAQVDGNSTLLEYRLVGASRDLPEGWKVVVMAERGALRIDLYSPDDERVEFPGIHRDELAGQVYDAIQAALAGAREA
ncbi:MULTISPECIES: hypothetical protein [Burkholderia]|uniref:hypothetical protein n=1 Tax=Burkholderia TaxID=32008 RepID=UPI001CF50A4D|nr:hypothetical protein [Burkholderia cepacia]MCA8328890.1 hypothetical protein [Burkholderia cepacia]UIY58218.1 hypothetical protein LZ568_08385 [Burkholderia cepacia]UIY58300.1 hypothetical protein LZ568_08810 [Burkholderia cepacia]